jgi:DNA-binding transcriptional MerR regulator
MGASFTRKVMVARSWWRIGDAARFVGVDEHVIRYWCDEFSAEIRPHRSAKGQRWYGPEQIAKLRLIRELLHVELYTIAGAKRQLRLAREREQKAEGAA